MGQDDDGHKVCRKNEINNFLEALKWRISSAEFDPEFDLAVQRTKEEANIEFTNANTLFNLGFTKFDIVSELKDLKVSEYSHSVIDIIDDKPPLLHVFGRDIQDREVYIKIKMKEHPNKKVICVSFHFAKSALTYPYAE